MSTAAEISAQVLPSPSIPSLPAQFLPSHPFNNSNLIPGLTDDVALLCLARVPHRHKGQLAQVCKSWCYIAKSSVLFEARARNSLAEDILCVFFLDQSSGETNGSMSTNPETSPTLHGPWRRNESQRPIQNGWIRRSLPPTDESPILDFHEIRNSEPSSSSTSPPLSPTSSTSPPSLLTPSSPSSVASSTASPPADLSSISTPPGIFLKLKSLPVRLIGSPSGVKPSDWFFLPPLRLPHCGPCDIWDLQVLSAGPTLCVLGGTVRIAGTSLISEVRQDVWVYDGVRSVWECVGRLEERGKKLVAACDWSTGTVFAAWSDEPQVRFSKPRAVVFKVGGEGRRWDPQPVPDMPPTEVRRYLHGAGCLSGTFYVFLIDPDSGRQWAETFYPSTGQWGPSVPSMPTKKAVVALRDGFLSLGNDPVDQSRDGRLAIERYSFGSARWQRVREFSAVEGRRSSRRTSVADCFLVGIPGEGGSEPDMIGKEDTNHSSSEDSCGGALAAGHFEEKDTSRLCVIGSWQEQSLAGNRWEHKANVSFVPLKPEEESSKSDGKSTSVTEGETIEGGLLFGGLGWRNSNSGTGNGVVNVRLRADGKVCLGGALLTV